MIGSFGNQATADVFNGRTSAKTRRLPSQIIDSALYKLDMLNAATTLDDLRVSPGNRLEALRGDYVGFYSIRINRQWRIVFRWQGQDAQEVLIVDYHR